MNCGANARRSGAFLATLFLFIQMVASEFFCGLRLAKIFVAAQITTTHHHAAVRGNFILSREIKRFRANHRAQTEVGTGAA
jgi:hypothetical protein